MKRASFGLILLLALGTTFSPRALAAVSLVGPVNYNTGMLTPISMVAADFNGDLRPDLAMLSNSGAQVMVRLNDGSGGFSTQVAFGTLGSPNELVAADLDLDGRRDLAIVRSGAAGVVSVSRHLGNGDGTFQAPFTSNAGTSSGGTSEIAHGDVDGDGRPDLAVVNTLMSTVSVLVGNPSGFDPPVSAGPAAQATDVALGDVNADGIQDIATIDGTLARVYLGAGAITWQPFASYMAGSFPTTIQIADMTGDGRGDLIVGNQVSGGTFAVTVLPSTPSGFGSPNYTAAGSGLFGGTEVAVADFDGDGKRDVAAVNPSLGSVRVMLGDGAGGFSSTLGFTAQTNGSAVASADFDGILGPDVAVAHTSPGNLAVYLQGQPPSAPQNLSVARGYRQLTLSWQPPSSGAVTGYKVFRGTSTGTETLLTTLGNVLGFTDTSSLGDNDTRYYFVKAFNGAGEGPASAEAVGTTFALASAPQNLTVAPGLGIGAIDVAWQAPADDGGTPVTGYVLCRSTTSGGQQFCATLGPGTTSYADSGALLQTYFYTVRAVNMVGQGTATGEACTKPFPWLAALGC